MKAIDVGEDARPGHAEEQSGLGAAFIGAVEVPVAGRKQRERLAPICTRKTTAAQ